MKGILLAGGKGTRLYPLTQTLSKQLLPVYDKPAIYYPLSTLMLAGIKEILVISTPRDLPMIRGLLGDGSQLGIQLSYAEQAEPRGIAEAFIIGEKFIGKDPVCLILGDNLFYGHDLSLFLEKSAKLTEGARIFAYHVRDPERYGLLEFDSSGKPSRLVEKPKDPKSNWAITGIYFYDSSVVEVAKKLKPSGRLEYEITDVNQHYLSAGKLGVEFLGRGFAWLDTGTPDSLLSAAQFVQTIEQRQGLKVACVEEIALNKGFINPSQFSVLVENCGASDYGTYLKQVLRNL